MVRVKRVDQPDPVEVVRYFREVRKQYYDQRTKEWKLSGNWKTHPLEAFGRVTRRKAYEDEFGDIVAGIGVLEEMPNPDEREGEPRTEDFSEDAEIVALFKALGYTGERQERHLALFKGNREGAVAKLKQECKARGIEIPEVEDRVVDAEFTEAIEGDELPPPEPAVPQDPPEAGEEPAAEDEPEAPAGEADEAVDSSPLEDFIEEGSDDAEQ